MTMIEKKLHLISSLISSAMLSVIFVTTVTIGGEVYAPLKNWLTSTFTHHWLGKSVLTAVLFFGITVVFMCIPRETSTAFALGRRVQRLSLVTTLSALALVGFFIYHYYTA